jgi:uncharacterized membrane protein
VFFILKENVVVFKNELRYFLAGDYLVFLAQTRKTGFYSP